MLANLQHMVPVKTALNWHSSRRKLETIKTIMMLTPRTMDHIGYQSSFIVGSDSDTINKQFLVPRSLCHTSDLWLPNHSTILAPTSMTRRAFTSLLWFSSPASWLRHGAVVPASHVVRLLYLFVAVGFWFSQAACCLTWDLHVAFWPVTYHLEIEHSNGNIGKKHRQLILPCQRERESRNTQVISAVGAGQPVELWAIHQSKFLFELLVKSSSWLDFKNNPSWSGSHAKFHLLLVSSIHRLARLPCSKRASPPHVHCQPKRPQFRRVFHLIPTKPGDFGGFDWQKIRTVAKKGMRHANIPWFRLFGMLTSSCSPFCKLSLQFHTLMQACSFINKTNMTKAASTFHGKNHKLNSICLHCSHLSNDIFMPKAHWFNLLPSLEFCHQATHWASVSCEWRQTLWLWAAATDWLQLPGGAGHPEMGWWIFDLTFMVVIYWTCSTTSSLFYGCRLLVEQFYF